MTVSLEPLTMQAAADFWRDKIKLGPAEFAALSDEAKIRAFGISGIAKGDELTTVFNSLQAAIEKGISYSEFKKECAEIFARRGWTGKREWRVQNIFRTNIQTAYNSGRYQSQKANADVFPFLQYNAVNDRRTRPIHAAMNGKVFPIGHQFWDTWYPPNGYRCRCSTLSLTEGQVKRLVLTVETFDPTDSPVEIADPVTGAKMTVQQLLPDPGFAHHPGKVIWGGIGEKETFATFKPMAGLAGPEDFGRKPLNRIKTKSLPEQADLQQPGREQVVKDAIGEPVIIPEGLEQQTGKDGEAIGTIHQTLTQPFEIWLTPQQDDATGKIRLAKRYLSLWQATEKAPGGVAVLEVVNGKYNGAVVLETYAQESLNLAEKERLGLLLFPKR
ncbi:MAG: minor capsid protein [Proteobacteria bacterium]|nr:minor capsid protein [Pseudomonadota bacterium]